MMRVCLTGGGGKLARALTSYFPQADAPTREFLDVADAGSCKRWFSDRTYDLIIHTAAKTNHDASPAAYNAVNVLGTANITHWARKQGARLVYTSTDYVYPADVPGPHREDAPLRPVNHYALSKLGGEVAVQSHANHLIVRGSWYGPMFHPSATTDCFTSKVPVERAADWIATLSTSTVTGIVNIGGRRRSLYEIMVCEWNASCQPTSRSQVSLPYSLPADCSLDTTKMRSLIKR